MDAFLSELFDVRGVDHIPFLDPLTGSLSHDFLMQDTRLICNAAFRFVWQQLSGGALPSARCFAEYNRYRSAQGKDTDTCTGTGTDSSLSTMVDWMLNSHDGPFHIMRDTSLMRTRIDALGDGRHPAYLQRLRDASTRTLHRSLVEKLLDRHCRDIPEVVSLDTLMAKPLFAVYIEMTWQSEFVSSSVQLTNLASGMFASHEEEREHLDGHYATACLAPCRVGRGDAIKRRFSRDLHYQRRQFGKPYLSAPPELMDSANVVRLATGAPWVVRAQDAVEVERHSPTIASACVRLHTYHRDNRDGVRPPARTTGRNVLILFGEGTDSEMHAFGLAHGYERILRARTDPEGVSDCPAIYSLYFGLGGASHWSYGILASSLRRHLVTPCPLETLVPSHARLLVDSCLTRLAIQRGIFDAVPRVFSVSPMARCVILAVETRADPSATVLSLALALSSLAQPLDWAVRVMCSHRNRWEMERMLRPMCPNVTLDSSTPELNLETFDVETSYNTLMKNPATWRSLLPSDVVLTVQDDGVLVRPGIEALMDHRAVYLGAPWADEHFNAPLKAMVPTLVGNGGLSLRNVRAMLSICEALPERESRRLFHNRVELIPEDVMYATMAAQLPSPRLTSIARSFSCEQVPFDAALGFHKPWPYWPVSATQRHMEILVNSPVPPRQPAQLQGCASSDMPEPGSR